MSNLADSRVLITGATSGIGLECARRFHELGAHLVLNGRRVERLQAIADEFNARRPDLMVELFPGDITDLQTVRSFFEAYTRPIDILVNNAGLALGLDPLHQGSEEDWDQMIRTNVNSLLYCTKFVSGGMVHRGRGHIVNIGSLAGHETYPGGAVYCATKHAVNAITHGLKKDLHGTGVRVSMVSPGLVDTEFSTVRFKGDRDRADSVYRGIDPLTAEDIAELVIFIATRPSHVNIMDMLVVPTAQSSSQMVHRVDV